VAGKGETSVCNATAMWSNALCTLGVTKPLCNCLSIRQVAAAAAAAAAANQNGGAAITTGPTAASNASSGVIIIMIMIIVTLRISLLKLRLINY